MLYFIEKQAREAPVIHSKKKTIERLTMEELDVGDAFIVYEFDAHMRCIWARAELRPKKFSVRKLARTGWQVRRTE